MTAINTQNLTLHCDGTAILDDITLSIPNGSVVGLVGRNGGGKSSLLHCLTGLIEPSRGHAHLLGCPSTHLTDAVRERLGYVAQTPDLFEWMEVLEVVRSLGAAYPRWSEMRALALAVQLDLPLGGRIRNLSTGDQQKLSVVMALAHNPDLLILDEPVASLDPMTRREFMRALFSSPLRADNQPDSEYRERTVLISSHLLSDLERVVTHVAFMREGRLQLFDAWDAMQEHMCLIPPDAMASLPAAPDAIIWTNQKTGQHIVDTRLTQEPVPAGRALSLDALFLELNA